MSGQAGLRDLVALKRLELWGCDRVYDAPSTTQREVCIMLWTIAVILVVLWALGFLAFHVAGGLIHLLLVIAVVVIVYQLVTGRRAV